MIAPSVMNLTALPAHADNGISTIDAAGGAIVDPGEPGSVAEAPDGGRSEWRRF